MAISKAKEKSKDNKTLKLGNAAPRVKITYVEGDHKELEDILGGHNSGPTALDIVDGNGNITTILVNIYEMFNKDSTENKLDNRQILEEMAFISVVNELDKLANKGSVRSVFLRVAEQFGLTDLLLPATVDSRSEGIPTTAPATFRERTSKSENAPTFVERVYGQWLTGEFTRADLRRLDPSAAQGLKNWERLHGKSDLNLPTIIERNDRKVEHSEATPEVREYLRLQSARQRRSKNHID